MERFYFQSDITIGEENHDSPGTLTGYAMKYNVLSHDRGGYRVVFRPGVFGESLNGTQDYDIRAYFNHNEESLLGRANNGTLSLATDEVGLIFKLKLPNTTLGRDTAELVRRKDINGMSFGVFYGEDDYKWKDEKGGLPIQEVRSGKLFEVSPVYDPSFPKTEVMLSSLSGPSESVLNSLQAWKLTQARTPRRNAAQRKLRILELGA